MKNSYLSLVVLLLVSACATHMDGTRMSAMESTLSTGAVGCAAGATVTTIFGGKPAAGCAAGALAGGMAAYLRARDAELADARRAQAAIPYAHIRTQQVAVSAKDSEEAKNVAAFKSLTVPMQARAATTTEEGQETLMKIGQLASKHQSLVFISGGTAAQRRMAQRWLVEGGATNIRLDDRQPTKAGELVVRVEAKDSRMSVVV